MRMVSELYCLKIGCGNVPLPPNRRANIRLFAEFGGIIASELIEAMIIIIEKGIATNLLKISFLILRQHIC